MIARDGRAPEFDVPAASDWQKLKTELVADGAVIHLRLLLPKCVTSHRRIVVEAYVRATHSDGLSNINDRAHVVHTSGAHGTDGRPPTDQSP